MFYWILHMTATGVLGVVFALSVSHKLRDYPRFQANLAAYRIVPLRLLVVAAPLVIALEVSAILALLLPVGPGLWIAFGMLSGYTLALLVNLLLGRTTIDCGCGDLPTPISGWLLLRNGVLLVIAFPYGTSSAAPGFAAWILVGSTVIVLSLFYLTIEQLLANRQWGTTERG